MNKKTIYYGYIVVAASTIIMIVAYGNFYSYSIFFNSLSSQFNWDKGTTSGVFSAAILVSGLVSIFAGRASDRLGPRAVSIFCGSALGLGFLLMSLVRSPWQVYLLYGIFLATGAGGLFPAAVSTVARWFTGKRGMMTGIVTAGLGVGSIIFAPVNSHLISASDWRQAYVIVGIIVLAIVVSAAQFLRREPDQDGTGSDVPQISRKIHIPDKRDFTYRQAIRTKQFWMVAVIYFFIGYSQFSVMVHIIPYATELRIDPISASSILSVIGASSIFSRLIIGGIGDRIRVKPLLISILIFLLSSLVVLEFAHQLWALFMVGTLFGLAYGGSSTVQPLVTVELFGLSSMGGLLGSLIFSVCIGGSLGPVLSGILVDISDSYQLAILTCIIASLAGLMLVLWLTPPKKRKESLIQVI